MILIWFVWLAEAAPKQNLRKVCGIYVRYSFFIFISNLVISWLVICYLTLFLATSVIDVLSAIRKWNNVVGMYKIIDNDNEKFVG